MDMTHHYDVIVCGGGTAGSCAAVAAARTGARTLVIEQMGFLGGTQTGGLVVPHMCCRAGGEQLIEGLHTEILDRLGRWPGGVECDHFNYELLKYVLEEMAAEAGVELLYHSFLAGSVVTGGRLEAVQVCNKSGMRAYGAHQFVDCTGDADVAHSAGVPCESGNPVDGVNQAATLRFVVGHVDLEALAVRITELGGRSCRPPLVQAGLSATPTAPPAIRDLVERGAAEGVYDPKDGGYIQFFSIPGRPGEVAFNCPRVSFVDGARAEDLTRVQVAGRRLIPKILEFCRRYLAGFEHAYLLATAPLPGIRESRRIVGEYVLQAEDCLSPTRFADRIAKSCYPIDVHSPSRTDVFLKGIPPGEHHDIPYRCLVPLGVDGLLVAGRCISATFEAQAAIRIQPTCRALGQAAGTAAALCVNGGCEPRHVPSDVLLATLASAGANVSA